MPAPVDGLAQCLPPVLAELVAADRDAITCCDVEDMSQKDYAARHGLNLSGELRRQRRSLPRRPAPARSVTMRRRCAGADCRRR